MSTSGSRSVSTNSAAALVWLFERMLVGWVSNQQLDGVACWNGIAGTGDEVSRSRLVHAVFLPMPGLLLEQLSAFSLGTPHAGDMAQQAERAILFSVTAEHKLKRSDLDTWVQKSSWLTHSAASLTARAKELAATAIEEISRSVESCREALKGFVDDSAIDPGIARPLNEALDWIQVALKVSEEAGILVGLVSSLSHLALASQPLVAAVALDPSIQGAGKHCFITWRGCNRLVLC